MWFCIQLDALEWIRDAEAKVVLQHLADGGNGFQTRQVKQTLKRIESYEMLDRIEAQRVIQREQEKHKSKKKNKTKKKKDKQK